MASSRGSIPSQAEEKKGAEEKVSKARGWALKRFIASVIQFLDDEKQHPPEAAPAFFESKEGATGAALKNQLKKSLEILQKLPAGSPSLLPSFIDELQKYEGDLKAKHSEHYLKSYHDFMKDHFGEKKEETQYHPIDKQKFETFLRKESKARELDLNLYMPKSLECLKAAGRLEGEEGKKNREYVLANSEHAKQLLDGLINLERDSKRRGIRYNNSDYQFLLEHPQFAQFISHMYIEFKYDNLLDDNARKLIAENLQYAAWIEEYQEVERCLMSPQYPNFLGTFIALTKAADELAKLKQEIPLSKEEQNKLRSAFDASKEYPRSIKNFCWEFKKLSEAKYFEGREGETLREAIFKDLQDCYDRRTSGFFDLIEKGFFEGPVGAELRAFLIENPQLASSVYTMLTHLRKAGFLEGEDQKREIYQYINDHIRYPDNIGVVYDCLESSKKSMPKEFYKLLFDNPQYADLLGIAFLRCYEAGMQEKPEWGVYSKLLLENQAEAMCLGFCIIILEKKTDLFKNESDRTRNLALLVKNAPFFTLNWTVSWLAEAGLLRGVEGQENFNTLMRYAAAHPAIYEAMRNTVPTQEGFDMIMEKVARVHEHNIQRTAPLIAFMRANKESALKYSFSPHLSDAISDLIGRRDQKGLREHEKKKSALLKRQR